MSLRVTILKNRNQLAIPSVPPGKGGFLMLVAIDQGGNLVPAWRASGKADYRCPACQGPVILRAAGPNRGSHFAHRSNDCGSGGESRVHQAGKEALYHWAQRNGWAPKLEVKMNGGRQRADLVIQLEQGPLVLEYQCSPLTISRLTDRTRGYHRAGYPVRWLLGPRYQRRLRRATGAAFAQVVGGTPCLTFWQPEPARLSYRWPPWQPGPGDDWRALTESRWLFTRRPVANNLAARAYQAGHVLAACPLLAHRGGEWWPLTVLSPLDWRIELLLALERVSVGDCWSWTAWWAWLEHRTAWLPLGAVSPAMAATLHRQVLARFTAEWERAGVFVTNKVGVTLRIHPAWFPSYAFKRAWLQKNSPTDWLGKGGL